MILDYFTVLIIISYISQFQICINAQSASNQLEETYIFTDAMKIDILLAHNDARSEVSPTAENMKRMSWDDELASVATQYSKQCVFEHNPARRHSTFGTPGENLYISAGIPFSPAYVTSSVNSWVNEKVDYDYQTGTCTPNKMCGHYTQIVWAGTYKVGCGASICSTINVNGQLWRQAIIFVCNYGPAGNFIGRLPYDQGQSCSGCSASDSCESNLCANPTRDGVTASVPTLPVAAVWSTWSEWSSCSRSCGVGEVTSTRSCSSRNNGDCAGSNQKTSVCYLQACPSWNTWRSWSSCSVSCDEGVRSRTRSCSSGNNADCTGINRMTTTCFGQPCPSGVANNQVLQNYIFDEDAKDSVLQMHNFARSTVSPTAENMRKMTWDDELADVASQFSKQCLFEHNKARSHSIFGRTGENIYLSTGRQFNSDEYIEAVKDLWVGEEVFYDYETATCASNKICGHYTQVVWADTYKVGCGASKCSTININGNIWRDATIFICNYGPAGNYRGVQPYKQGTPCSACDIGETCENNLCYNPTGFNTPSPFPDSGGSNNGIFSSWFPETTWGPWQSWSSCSQSCGGGKRTRTRYCSAEENQECFQRLVMTATCNFQPCP